MRAWILQFVCNILEVFGSGKEWCGGNWEEAGGYQTCQHLLHLQAPGLGAPRLWGAPVGDMGGPLLPDISGEGRGSRLGEEGNEQVIWVSGGGDANTPLPCVPLKV